MTSLEDDVVMVSSEDGSYSESEKEVAGEIGEVLVESPSYPVIQPNYLTQDTPDAGDTISEEQRAEILEATQTDVQCEEEDRIRISCPVCYDEYSSSEGPEKFPITLKCTHAVCFGCISKTVPSPSKPGRYTCPSCQEPAIYQGIDSLRKDVIMLQEVARAKKQRLLKTKATDDRQETHLRCSCCEEEEKDVGKYVVCTECKLNMCPSCEVGHRKFPATRTHMTLKLKSLNAEEIPGDNVQSRIACQVVREENTLQILPNECPLHRSIILFQCDSDNSLLCSFCLLNDHNGHKVHAVTTRFDQMEQGSFDKKLKETNRMLQKLKALDAELEDSQKRLHADLENISSVTIQARFDDLHMSLEKIKKHISNCLNSAFSDKMSFLCQKKFEIQSLIQSMTVCQEQLQSSFEKKYPIQSCIMMEEVDVLMKQIENMIPTYFGYAGMPLLSVHKDELEKLNQALSVDVNTFAKRIWEKPNRKLRLKKEHMVKSQDIQVLWNNNAWYKAKIIEVGNEVIQITYPGWPSKWDEWISMHSHRLAIDEL